MYLSRSLRGSVDWNCRTLHAVCWSDSSLPSRERGLKSDWINPGIKIIGVAPFAGAWIEIAILIRSFFKWFCRSLRGSVDWNIDLIRAIMSQGMSLPSRERGLKFRDFGCIFSNQSSRSLRGSVDWNIIRSRIWDRTLTVAPFAGAWIEIKSYLFHFSV